MTEITEETDISSSAVAAGRVAFSYRQDPGVPAFPDDHALLVYDGNCRLCSRVVRFVLHRDRYDVFRFVAAQSELGRGLYKHYGRSPTNFDTYIVLEQGLAYFKSEAAMRLFTRLGLPWSLIVLGRIVPGGLRDRLYDGIARNRLRWFGASRTCDMPDPQQAHKFLG